MYSLLETVGGTDFAVYLSHRMGQVRVERWSQVPPRNLRIREVKHIYKPTLQISK